MKKKVVLCKKCGEPIAFVKLASGKLCPTNVDGSEHFDVCREVRNKKLGTTQINEMSSGVIVGSQYVELPPLPEGEAPWN